LNVTAKRDLRIDKSLNHAAKLVAAVEGMYVFRGNWPSGFAAVEPDAAAAGSTGASGSGSKEKK
jgi:hypothetical protein